MYVLVHELAVWGGWLLTKSPSNHRLPFTATVKLVELFVLMLASSAGGPMSPVPNPSSCSNLGMKSSQAALLALQVIVILVRWLH
jgi:hypothetical protein